MTAEADELKAIQSSLNDAAGQVRVTWFAFITFGTYLVIAVGSVTHRMLFLETPIKLPVLNVDLSLVGFFVVAPILFLIFHFYMLFQLLVLSRKFRLYNTTLASTVGSETGRSRLRLRLEPFVFVQFPGGAQHRIGFTDQLARVIAPITTAIGPVLVLFQLHLTFLPYHLWWVTWLHRVAIIFDLALVWWFRRAISFGEGGNRMPITLRFRVMMFGSMLVAILSLCIATFPGEQVEKIARQMPGWTTLHDLLFAGEVNYVTGKPQSWLSNVLVLPEFEVVDGSRSNANGGTATSSPRLSLRGRPFEGAVLAGAHLRNADFTGASLQRANFVGADLREAKFECEKIGGGLGFFSAGPLQGENIICARLQGANFDLAQLQGASLRGAQLHDAIFLGADLHGASLVDAQLQGAGFPGAQLQGALLGGAQLQGAWLSSAQLQGANLDQAQLQGAVLVDAQLEGASLNGTQLQGANLFGARLEGASLRNTFVWRTDPPSNTNGALVNAPEPGPKYSGLDCPLGPPCEWSKKSYEALKLLIESSSARDQALRQISILEKPPYRADKSSAEAWTNLAEVSARSAGSYFNTLAEILKEIGCAADGAPYVINGLMRPLGAIGLRGVVAVNLVWLDRRFEGNPSQEAEIANSFLDETKCPGARGLSEENKAKLRDIRDLGRPAAAGPAAATR
jgi:uncharacterized protein YjbI with pentapeptide repeats